MKYNFGLMKENSIGYLKSYTEITKKFFSFFNSEHLYTPLESSVKKVNKKKSSKHNGISTEHLQQMPNWGSKSSRRMEIHVNHVGMKKGGRRQCSNYRGRRITSSVGLYGRIFNQRIEREVEIGEEQSGFTNGISFIGNIFTIKHLIYKMSKKSDNILNCLNI